MRIPKTSVQTSWRADWLIEFSIAFIALAFLAREVIFAVVGAGILLALASLSFLFHRGLEILRRELDVVERLPKARAFLGDSIGGELIIRNGSRLAAQILAVVPVVEKGSSFRLSSYSDQLLRPGATSRSKFEITLLKSGRFQISGFALTFTDARRLFTGKATYAQANWVEVIPGMRTRAPLTPLRLYGGSLDVFRKALTGTDCAGIREYVPGDEYHRVEWKATARLRTLMVKEFHPETQTNLQILIDAGRTMHQQSYTGTRLDEAIAIAQLLLEAAKQSGNRVGIWVYDESEILRSIGPAMVNDLVISPELVLCAQEEQRVTRIPLVATLRQGRPRLPGSGRLAVFMRLLGAKLGIWYRKAGIFKALNMATRANSGGFLIVLTDLKANIDALKEALIPRAGNRIIVAQIGADWKLGDTLEEACVEYERNQRTIEDLRQLGSTVFDLRPERLVEALLEEMRRRPARKE